MFLIQKHSLPIKEYKKIVDRDEESVKDISSEEKEKYVFSLVLEKYWGQKSLLRC